MREFFHDIINLGPQKAKPYSPKIGRHSGAQRLDRKVKKRLFASMTEKSALSPDLPPYILRHTGYTGANSHLQFVFPSQVSINRPSTALLVNL